MIAIAAAAEFFFDSKLGKALLIAAGIALALAWFASEQRAKGAAAILEKSRQAGKVANAKNEVVRRRAAEPGAAARLLSESCRDCDKGRTLP